MLSLEHVFLSFSLSPHVFLSKLFCKDQNKRKPERDKYKILNLGLNQQPRYKIHNSSGARGNR